MAPPKRVFVQSVKAHGKGSYINTCYENKTSGTTTVRSVHSKSGCAEIGPRGAIYPK